MESVSPAESAQTEDSRLSIAREAAEVVPVESTSHNEIQHLLCMNSQKQTPIHFWSLLFTISHHTFDQAQLNVHPGDDPS